jgi:SAM-dependent methyltransferase
MAVIEGELRASGPEYQPAAYDSIAGDYDALMSRDLPVRRIQWRRFSRAFRPEQHVVDVGCGTGLDTVFLASRGMKVTAIDGSPGMVAQLRTKLAGLPFQGLVETRIGDINEVLRDLPGPYDGMVSSFAALNTSDLAAVANEASRLVSPGGRVIFHMLSPGRRFEKRDVTIRIGGRGVVHPCLRAHEMYSRFFAPDFILRRASALGFFLRDSVIDRFPRVVTDALGVVESLVGSLPPFRSWGRFVVLDLERRPLAAGAGLPSTPRVATRSESLA